MPKLHCIGICSDFFQFQTPSWSRGQAVIHYINVCRRSGVITCTCEDAHYRKKKGDVLDRPNHVCKHVQALLDQFDAILAPTRH